MMNALVVNGLFIGFCEGHKAMCLFLIYSLLMILCW